MDTVERLSTRRLRRAILNLEIVPWFQPLIRCTTGEVVGVEVLARWRLSARQMVMPDSFIPLAERSGLVIPLTQKLMLQVSAQLPLVIARLRQPFHIAFNIDSAHLMSRTFVDECLTFMAAFPPGSVQLALELTERQPVEITPAIRTRVSALRLIGIFIELDDFGTGYSNLGYLNALTVDCIKIDRSFISVIGADADSTRLVDSMIEMATKLGLSIVAEGVETEQQLSYLAAKGVDFLQGYYFAAPLPLAAFVRLAVLQKKVFQIKS